MLRLLKTRWFVIPVAILSLLAVDQWWTSKSVYLGQFYPSNGTERDGRRAAMKELSTLLVQHPRSNIFTLRWHENLHDAPAKAYVRMVYKRSNNMIKIDDDADFSFVTRLLSKEPEQYADISVVNVREEHIHKAATRSEHFRDLSKYGCKVFLGRGTEKTEWK